MCRALRDERAKSIETFLTPEQLAEMSRGAGFSVEAQRRMTFGVCVATLAVLPEAGGTA